MAQIWRDLLFAHWPVAWDMVRQLVPPSMELDRRDGDAWIGVVPFRMTGIRPHGLFAAPKISETLELNVRTYVTVNGKAGVYFFSLDAASVLAVRVARRFFHLPYFDAEMTCREDAGQFRYESRRVQKDSPAAQLSAVYEAAGAAELSRSGSLEAFLTERYCLYTADTRGTLYRGDIHHEPWPLQPARAEFGRNTMTGPLGIDVQGRAPLLHFARELHVKIWALSPC